MSKTGRPKGSGEMTDQITVRVPDGLKERLDALAKADRRNRSNYIIRVLEKHLEAAEYQADYGKAKPDAETDFLAAPEENDGNGERTA